MTFIDTNVLLDLLTDDPIWCEWSVRSLDAAATRGRLIASDIVYAEMSARVRSASDLDAFFESAGIELEPPPRPALFLAGKAFAAYRARGGKRTGVLPDFLIGAHAAARNAPLLTRDRGRLHTDFPTLNLLAP